MFSFTLQVQSTIAVRCNHESIAWGGLVRFLGRTRKRKSGGCSEDARGDSDTTCAAKTLWWAAGRRYYRHMFGNGANCCHRHLYLLGTQKVLFAEGAVLYAGSTAVSREHWVSHPEGCHQQSGQPKQTFSLVTQSKPPLFSNAAC